MYYSVILCNTLQYSLILCNTLQYSDTLCNTLQYSAILCNTKQYQAEHIPEECRKKPESGCDDCEKTHTKKKPLHTTCEKEVEDPQLSNPGNLTVYCEFPCDEIANKCWVCNDFIYVFGLITVISKSMNMPWFSREVYIRKTITIIKIHTIWFFQAQIFHENLEVPKAQQILELSAFTKVIAQRS